MRKPSLIPKEEGQVALLGTPPASCVVPLIPVYFIRLVLEVGTCILFTVVYPTLYTLAGK